MIEPSIKVGRDTSKYKARESDTRKSVEAGISNAIYIDLVIQF